MTFDEAMHAECDWCGDMAMNHRLTDGGNFYCLEPGSGNPWMRNAIKQRGPKETKLWAITRAKCNDLRKSPLPKDVGKVIVDNWRTLPSPTFEQMEMG
jgi:hypothetical protein